MRTVSLLRALALCAAVALGCWGGCKAAESASRGVEEMFLNPTQQHKPLIIWQWMDGLVTREGITRDLEAFKEAGLAGVQNFQIGGPRQMRIGNPENAIGSENWKELIRWTLDECERLGLTFGTHNCPGWSSSAYPTVRPESSMLKLVYSETPWNGRKGPLRLNRPEVDSLWSYYEDVAVMAVPADSVASKREITDLSQYFNRETGVLKVPAGVTLPKDCVILRIGQTTIGKTNEAQAPESGRGLECDKLSREAVKEFWDGYPSMVLETAGRHVGSTFTHFEIDSYEAGGQTWSPVLPAEFRKRTGEELLPFLPLMAGRLKMVEDEETTVRFMRQWEDVVTRCVAENYYGYLTELATEAGVKMLIEPYGTGGQRPFRIIDFEKIVTAAPQADVATEFWQEPNWGWRDMGRHEASMRRLGRRLLIAEAFTCWPLRAWSDSPETIKPVCDRAFCTGVNRMMLHAGAANPWPGALPGMSFGIWGTHFVPGQTWWMAGGARELFGYMARCQALLQQGVPAMEQLPAMEKFRSYHRSCGDMDIIFLCNPSDSVAEDGFRFGFAGRGVEVWDPYTMSMNSLDVESDSLSLAIEALGSRFVIVRPGKSDKPCLAAMKVVASHPVEGGWSVDFPEIGVVETDTLFSWPASAEKDIRYFSGTASYRKRVDIPAGLMAGGDSGRRIYLSLGDVKNMASVSVNGQRLPLLWKSPYECDMTDVIKPGENLVEISVTNLWPNRMIGDEQEPDDLQWSEPLVYTYAPGSPVAGRYLTVNPDWLKNGEERPSKGRKTVGCFKFFSAESPLLPSGMTGPVEILVKEPERD